MEESSKKVGEIKHKIKSWLSNKYNLAFLGILLFTIAIRLYYFILTKNQPLWWDEAEYMSTAKSFAGIIHIDYHWALNRFPGFPFLVSLFYLIGINNEVLLRFFVAFIPSILAIVLMYYILVSMYSDKRIALIAVAIFSVLWEHVFYSNRLQTENWSLIFEFLAILILFKVYLKKQDWGFIKSKYSLIWISLFSILCILFRSGYLFFIPIMVLFLILINIYRLKEKSRITALIGLATLIVMGFILLVFLSNKITFLQDFIYRSNYPISWSVFSVFYGFYQSLIHSIPSILFYAFLIGFFTVLISIVIFPEFFNKLSPDIDDNSYKADIFNLILVLGFLFFFMFMLRPPGFEYRWFFAFLPGMFAFTAIGLIKTGDFAKSLFNTKYISILLIILLLGIGMYAQYNHADMIVKNKIDSYSQVRDAGLWLRENSNKEDIIIDASETQDRYYSERDVLSFYAHNINQTDSVFDEVIAEYKPRYLVVSVFEPAFTPKWIYTWPEKHNQTVTPVQIFYDTQNKQQPVLVIYEFHQEKALSI